MANAKQTITQEVATSILTKLAKNVIKEVGQGVENTEITSINYTKVDEAGNTVSFTYPSGDEYAIVNVRAINQHQLAEAVALFKAGDFAEACNKNMSLQMPVAEAQKLGAKSFGTLTCQLVDLKDKETGLPNGEQAIMPYSFVPNVKIKQTGYDFMSLIAEEVVNPAITA